MNRQNMLTIDYTTKSGNGVVVQIGTDVVRFGYEYSSEMIEIPRPDWDFIAGLMAVFGNRMPSHRADTEES